MEGLREDPFISDSASHATTGEKFVSEGQSLVSAGLVGMMDLPGLRANLETSILDRSGAALRAPNANPPQESFNVSAERDV